MANQAVVLPFTAAAHRYREKIFTTTYTPGTAQTDLSPPGGAIKSYGYLRALRIVVTSTGGSGGNNSADAPWDLFSQVAITQPNGEELFGGPTFSGYHTFTAARHAGWKYADDPQTYPSLTTTSPNYQFDLPIVFELLAQTGVGSLPNQDFSAPWKLQLTGNTSANIWQTAPTTIPTFTVSVFMDCWTVPSRQNPLNPNVVQEVAPPLLGTLNKWTVQQYTVTAASSQNVLLQRKGNSIRNLVCLALNSSNARVGATPLFVAAYPDPISVRWDGTVIRSNDKPLLWLDDMYATMGGEAGSTPVTAQVGELALKMSDVAGLDTQGVALPGYAMGAQWGTTQSSTLEIDGTWGASIATLQVLTNDVQFVNLAGNPYAFQYPGGVYLQAPAQVSARS
ncbi:MAG TPA: hypothetical protein VN903_40150 [Polyangia bacterium]|nr:hypothetical protein [Polyangia bacterium]